MTSRFESQDSFLSIVSSCHQDQYSHGHIGVHGDLKMCEGAAETETCFKTLKTVTLKATSVPRMLLVFQQDNRIPHSDNLQTRVLIDSERMCFTVQIGFLRENIMFKYIE